MKLGVMKQLTIANRFFSHLHCNIAGLAIITRKLTMKIEFLKDSKKGNWQSINVSFLFVSGFIINSGFSIS